MKKALFWMVVLAAVLLWTRMMQRRLHIARMRGDMYRDIAARLDRRLAEQTVNTVDQA
ncbi:MAG: hypothetical protein HC837_19140 [Chloroflexaceae bacterium]|nr:hypothetical protein [Chloroflexaceae bacterium]